MRVVKGRDKCPKVIWRCTIGVAHYRDDSGVAEGACGYGSVPGGWRLDGPLTVLGSSLAEAVTTPCPVASGFPTKEFRGENGISGTLQPLTWRVKMSQSRFAFRGEGGVSSCVASESDSPQTII